MGDLRHQILLARGSYGEPLFDREMNYLYIGQKNSGANNPITSDRVWGKINNIEYSFNADSTGAYIKSNTSKFSIKDNLNANLLNIDGNTFIIKSDLKSGNNIIYTSSTDTLTVTDISSRSGGTLSNFGINTGNRDIWTGSGTISTSTSVTTPEISGVNNTLSIDATSGVNFNGKITSNDLLINSRADIDQINANELAISKTSGIGISCYDSAIATKEIQASSTNILNINASAGVIFNGDITASGKNITAAKFIGNLTGNITGYAGQISTVFTTSSATFTLTDGTSTKNIVFIY